MYGKTVRGLMKVLKELWTNKNEESEVKTSYQHVFELRERLEKTIRLVQEELRKSQGRYKQYYDRKAKERVFKEGDKVPVLVMLPTNNKKLLMQWQGPYKVVRKQGENDYVVDISNKTKLYHANMLNLYHYRKTENETDLSEVTAVAGGEQDMPSVDDDALLEP